MLHWTFCLLFPSLSHVHVLRMDALPATQVYLTKFSSNNDNVTFFPDNICGRQDNAQAHEVCLSWRNLSYEITTRTDPLKWVFSPKTKRTVLKPMSGVITSGTMTALMGPSGSGKTTLLNCLSGKINRTGLSGEVMLSSKGKSTNIRIGFVPQEDHFLDVFTVKEVVEIASKLNNSSFSRRQHKGRINEVLQSLDLGNHTHHKVSKLSGGQQKRVSVALELVSRPQILFLDEPTSGLDSDNTEKLIVLLKNLSRGAPSDKSILTINSMKSTGPAIMMTIHSPSGDVFKMFDNIYLLNRFGFNIYSEVPNEARSFFTSFGFSQILRSNSNPVLLCYRSLLILS